MEGLKLISKAAAILPFLLLATIVEAGYDRHRPGNIPQRPVYIPHRPPYPQGGEETEGIPPGLIFGYYNQSCPQAETVIRRVVESYIRSDKTLAPSLLRMHFHDCFVQGCDGSILLNSNSNSSMNKTEKDAAPNLSLRGFNVIDAVKKALEAECEATVSCADILTVVARDSVNLLGGPNYRVPLGRRDGFTSFLANANTLPAPFFNFSQLKDSFLKKNLTVKDLVVLSGAHTIGFSHCRTIIRRLYNFSGKSDTDPSLDPFYAAQLKKECKPGDSETKVPMDLSGSELRFDTQYFRQVEIRRGLFQSDAALLDDKESLAILRSQAGGVWRNFPFFNDFPSSMTAMGRLGVLIGHQGEIRTNCSVVNVC